MENLQVTAASMAVETHLTGKHACISSTYRQKKPMRKK
jgi:hypothetical protein